MARSRILLLGHRRGALRAAAELEAEVVLFDDGPPRRSTREAGARHVRARVADERECIRVARALYRYGKPDAVIALSERAVLTAAALRVALGVAGPRPERAILWRDKLHMKERIGRAGLALAQHRLVDPTSDAGEVVRELALPVVLKPRASSGGRGRVIAWSELEVRRSIAGQMLAERFVHGSELSVESFVWRGRVLFENVTEYLVPEWANLAPAVLGAELRAEISRFNREVLAALEVENGMTHLELFLASESPPRVVFGELAARPPGGAIMELITLAYGFDPWRALIELELDRGAELPGSPRSSAGVWLLHPDPGEVVAIAGLDAAREVEDIARIDCRMRVGDLVPARSGTGDNRGRIVSHASTRERALRALLRARDLLQVRTQPRAA